MKKLVGNLLLSCISIGITLLLAEFAFRLLLFSEIKAFQSLRIASYYSDHAMHKGEDLFNDNYWKLTHLFKGGMPLENPHPLLGWIGAFNEEDYQHADEHKMGEKRPVLLFGDSFAMCVDTVSCFEDVLNADPDFSREHYFLNYGVGGYGIDQIHLLFNEVRKKKRYYKPFIVFSMLTTDMDRSMLSIRDAQKPYFHLNEDSLQLKGAPLNQSTNAFLDKHPPNIDSYLWKKFKSSDLNILKADDADGLEYIEKCKALNGAILEKSFTALKAMNTDFIVLIFNPMTHGNNNWRINFLRDLCLKNEVPFLTDWDIKLAHDDEMLSNQQKYVIKNDGHPTSYANKIVANAIKRVILNKQGKETLLAKNKQWRKDKRKHEIKDVVLRIRATEKWLSKVKKQAVERNIPLDSMILLNAIYIVDEKLRKRENEIQKTIARINNTPSWLASVKQQSIDNSIPLDSMILLNALYAIEHSN